MSDDKNRTSPGGVTPGGDSGALKSTSADTQLPKPDVVIDIDNNSTQTSVVKNLVTTSVNVEKNETGEVRGPLGHAKRDTVRILDESDDSSSEEETVKIPRNPNRPDGTAIVPATILCRYCKSADHKVWDCPKAPSCGKCGQSGHQPKQCTARETDLGTVCFKCGLSDHISKSCPQGNSIKSYWDNLSKKQKLERRARIRNAKARQRQANLDSLAKSSVDAALLNAPKVVAQNTTYSDKVSTNVGDFKPIPQDNSPLPVPIGADGNVPTSTVLSGGIFGPVPPVPTLTSSKKKELGAVDDEDPTPVVIDLSPLIHYQPFENQVHYTRNYHLPSLAFFAIIWAAFWFSWMVLALEGVRFSILFLFAVFLTLSGSALLYLTMRGKLRFMVVQMESRYLDPGTIPDHRTDVQRIQDLKHSNQHVYEASFSWATCPVNGDQTEVKPYRPFIDIYSSHFWENLMRGKFNNLAWKPPKLPLNFVYSAEALTQFCGPNNLDLTSSIEEVVTRMNYNLRNFGSVPDNRYGILHGKRPIADAAIAAVVVVSHERWTKRMPSLN